MVEEKIAQIELDNLVFYLKNKLKEKNIYLNKYHAQKALFKIKMDLGEDHPLYDCLPYYWYYYGPFSEPVADSFNYILDNRGDFTPKDISIEYPEVEDIVNGLIKNKNFFYNELPKFIYKKYAPYAFLYDFKFNIYDIAAKQRSPESVDVDKLLETFLNCEGKLPYEEYFYDFSDLFSWLSIKIDLINDDGTFNRYWSDLRSPIKQLWITFAKGLRVVKKDDFYNGNTKIWDLEFKESLKSLKFKVINSVNTDNIFPREEDVYDELDKKILDATIGSYLRN